MTDRSTIRAAKAALRKTVRDGRAGLARDAAADAAMRLTDNLFAAGMPGPATVVSGYWPSRDEIDCRPLLERLNSGGCLCALPVVTGPGRPLSFRRWSPGEPLEPGAHGIPVPAVEARLVAPSLLLVPLLAFDRAGYRLGYGGGYYDRTLARLRAGGTICAIGLAYSGQEVAAVPHDETDAPLDRIVTEAEAIEVKTP